MKNMRYILFVIGFFSSSLSAQVNFTHDIKRYYTESTGCYIESHIQFDGSSLKYVPNDSGILQSQLLVTQLIKRNNEIILVEKYEVLGPELIDSFAVDFIDQKRFILPYDTFSLEISIVDLNRTTEIKSDYSCGFRTDSIASMFFSDVQFVESYAKSKSFNAFTKSGFDIMPLLGNYLDQNVDKLVYYIELYNSERIFKNDGFLVKQYIRKYSKSRPYKDYVKYAKLTAKSIHAQLNAFNIKDLATGNYELVFEVRNKSNELELSKSYFFQRLNPKRALPKIEYSEAFLQQSFVNAISADTIDLYISMLIPIAEDMERDFIQYKQNVLTAEKKKGFFYHFWKNRNEANPEQAWQDYLKEVKYVDGKFGTRVRKGFETDRGRIYLQYGKPNTLTDRQTESNSYPYQIWHYYHIKNWNDIKFVFYAPDIVGEDYELLHSNMNGEVQNRRWQSYLQRDRGNGVDPERDQQTDQFGTRSSDEFALPR